MNKLLFSIIIISIISFEGSKIFGQDKPINMRYKGEEEAFIQFIYRNIRYPVVSVNNQSVGYSIASFCVTPNGKIKDVDIINQIDSLISEEIRRVIRKSEPFWKKLKEGGDDQIFYAQFIFNNISMNDDASEIINPVNKKYDFLEPVVITAMNMIAEDPLPEPNDSIIIKFNNSLRLQKYEEALKSINELIERNPFSKEYYEYRMYVNRKIGNNDKVVEDAEKIRNFIPGVALDDLINKN